MHPSDSRHDRKLLSLPAEIAEATWTGWQCIAHTLHHQRCEPASDRRSQLLHLLRWLAGNLLLVGLLYLLYRYSRF
ncbi:hypothetical protein DLM_0203 [Aquitalea magnusonii]|uniref:Uncharacterized protein n=1 Tax=Aquitalea magnusonii TaxID=332411 RepID=A0A3G9G8I1_9NEIS|nr:hypothetical protein [Aquitalea magnusonii]BBF83885.1 hypothetical protein DLM_0203 [Aquitalea magnusonii]